MEKYLITFKCPEHPDTDQTLSGTIEEILCNIIEASWPICITCTTYQEEFAVDIVQQ